MKWKLLNSTAVNNSKKLKKILIENRDIQDADAFFQPINPFDISLESVDIDVDQLTQSIDRIRQAIEKEEKISVFGDYDADGICATAILWTTLNKLGAKAFPFIPNREKHGYGISQVAIDEILQAGKPDLVITVDNGIVAFDEVEQLVSHGIDVIVTDHHQPESKDDQLIFPNATQVVQSTKLCGATVAWIIARELDLEMAKENLDLAGIATIADQVPLTDANRSFAKYGIEALQETTRPGLLSLINKANSKKEEIDSTKINYVIAPRINAMGRLEDGLDALRLLCTKSQAKATQLSSLLDETNDRRKDLTFDMVNEAQSQAEQWRDDNIIIVHSTEYHEGVIGLIAGRLSEKYYKPAIAISVGDVTAKASARSVFGVNIVELIRQVKSDLLAVGGHPMAAGFGVEVDKMEMVIDKLKQLALKEIDQNLLEPVAEVDCILDKDMVSIESFDLVAQFEPFGQRNPVPIFQINDLELVDAKTIGKENNHIKLLLQGKDGLITCLGWNKADKLDQLSPGKKIDILATLQLNVWNGRKSIQLVMKDLKVKE